MAGGKLPRLVMSELKAGAQPARTALFTTRKTVHMSMLGFAFLLPFLTWVEAAGCAILALLFNLFVLPQLDTDLSKRSRAAAEAGAGAIEDHWTGIVLYPIAVLALILAFHSSMPVVAGVWAIMALGDGMAGVVGERLIGPGLPWNKGKTWPGFLAFIVAGTAGAYVLARWVNDTLPPARLLWVCLATALVGAVVESMAVGLDDNATVPLVCGAFMYCAFLVEPSALDRNLPYLGRRIVLAVGICLVFSLLALTLKMVNVSGAMTGFILAVVVYMGYGYKSFLIFLGFFLLGSLATRLGYAKKAARGVAEKRGGARSWREALANTLAGSFFAVLVITTHQEAAFLVAMIASFSEAAGDTVSSEIGQWLSDRAYLITTLRPVAAGENGGVSLSGTVAGFAASSIIVGVGYSLGLCGGKAAGIALAAALAGNLLDSLLGATFERQGRITNAIVNFAGTSAAGGIALALALHYGI
jgi:uncharacterized protein (TIGR00297 family)